MKRKSIALLLASLAVAAAFWLSSPVVAQPADEVRLGLDRALRVALENNLDLVAARVTPEISGQSVTVQEATFDGTISAFAQRSEQSQEPTDISRAPGSRSNTFNVGWGKQLDFGGNYSVTLTSREQDISGSSFFFTTPTSFETSLAFDVTVPLLNGLGKETAQEGLLLARRDLDISREDLRLQAHSILETVEAAYWDLVAARQALEVARQSLKRAEDLLGLNRKKVEVGTLAPIEITQAEAGVASQEEGVIVAEANLGNAEDELRRLLAVPASDPMWLQRMVLTDEPLFEPRPQDLEAAIEQALASRPEVLNARTDVRKKELSERVARRALRHTLDLNVRYTPAGTDTDEFIQSAGPDGILDTPDDRRIKIGDGSLPDAVGEIPDLVNRSWSASVTYAYPFNNRAARASYRIAELQTDQSEVALRNQEQSIRVEVRRAVRGVDSGAKRVGAARSNVVLQRKKLEAEQKKFENGMSTSFEVLTFQNDLANAELSEIQALVDYQKALAGLERSKGTLLEARGLRLEP